MAVEKEKSSTATLLDKLYFQATTKGLTMTDVESVNCVEWESFYVSLV